MKMEMKVSTIVKPAAETPGGSIWLSNLDLLMPATYHTQAVSFYRSNGAANFFDATVLKEALSRALVEFYPYAGRLRRGPNNRLEIDCNGKGVLFVEAECDASVDDFTSDFIPNSDLNLIPTVDYSQGISTFPLMIIQLTRFKCGGVCLGVAKEHHVSDGVSGLHLLFTWSHLVRGQTFGFAPIFDRSLLAARNPPRPSFSHIEYQPPPPLTTPLLIQNDSETTFSMFKITRYQMNALKVKCNDGNALLNYTSYEAFAGHVWRCVCMARGLPQDQETKLHMPVDGRSRLKPALPLTFFGNVIFSATPVALSGELVANPLNFTVGKVHDAIARLDDEYLRSALDYLELQGDVSAIARGTHTTRCPNLGIISWAKLPIYSADYGWGKPVYSGFGAAPHEGKSYLLPCPENDGSLLYGLTLLKPHMEVFKKLIYDI